MGMSRGREGGSPCNQAFTMRRGVESPLIVSQGRKMGRTMVPSGQDPYHSRISAGGDCLLQTATKSS